MPLKDTGPVRLISKSVKDYYKDMLFAQRLKQCYEIASPRIQQYLKAEIDHVLKKINPRDIVLELGCGYGRVLYHLAQKASVAIGIDTSFSSLEMAKETIGDFSNCCLFNMDAVQLAFCNRVFDCVVCVQNGISAFHVDQQDLIKESIRVTSQGGRVLLSSYSDRFWDERLEWFIAQSEAGLLGEIDYEKTQKGVIVCKDGFTAATMRASDFLMLTQGMDLCVKIEEVDGSSVFYEIITPRSER